MKARRILNLAVLVSLVISLFMVGNGRALAQEVSPSGAGGVIHQGKITQADREAAAARAKENGFTLPEVGTVSPSGAGNKSGARSAVASAAVSSDAPHYFSAPNYANSPQRMADAVITFTGDGIGAVARATVDSNGTITAIEVVNGGSGYTTAPTVTITAAMVTPTSPASASAEIDSTGAVTAVTVIDGGAGYITPGIRKFVDTLPGLGPSGANNLGQYIPVAQPDTTSYPGADYYEIAVVEYEEQMHTDLAPTTLRGYVQLSTDVVPGGQVPLTYLNGNAILLPDGSPALAVDKPHYLGPVIAATRDRPVRILFRNLLPTGADGNLFIPVDTTVMGAGMTADMGGMMEMDPHRPMCGQQPKPAECYTENRATLHLHGGISPWISDGTPHQWITPAGENTAYPEGVSVTNVPDMPDPGPGAMTFFYTNQQSARLMFYHDHSWGITRLNVYAGEAAGYIITDPVEQNLINNGIIPGPADTLPLIVQDKTFVDDPAVLAVTDPLWDYDRWGQPGDLWLPHVYSPAQNPGDSSGVNQFGRWAYGPWFWPPTNSIYYKPVDNPYFDESCNPDLTWCEPPLMPGVPFNSMGMEAFHDTPLVNGTAYPTVTVEPKAYRFRILNAANDRFFNLSLYQADATGTEVTLDPALVAAALEDTTVFPTPDPSTKGPDWIQIGTEGGFLPTPVVIPAHETTWVNDPTVFNAGNVDQHSLLLGPAERADVIVDFSAFAGQTLILYNDAPAAFPARDPRYDYYTGNADLRDTGGAAPTVPGYGPNTRTVMQIKVEGSAAGSYNLNALMSAFAHQPDGSGVFESSQNPIIVGQGAYNAAYGSSFYTNGPRAGLAQIHDSQLTFDTLAGNALTIPFQWKAIQDEMGEAFEKEYGRMSGNLGLEVPNTEAGTQQKLILYPFVNPATEVLDGIELQPGSLDVTPIATADDGTQIWKITHNGVDTHPIHWHLSDVQLINRVGWDGIIRRPDPNELGWKETIRISPLEDTIVAVRPIIPKVPFGVPDSIRPLNPMMPLGSTEMFNSTDGNGNPINPPITNQIVNFGWEYVWHCHILSHEEMDMMRPISVAVARALAQAPVLSFARTAGPVTLNWTDGTPVNDPLTMGNPAGEVGYRIERAVVGSPDPYTVIATALANQTSFVDETADELVSYNYQVVAYNAAGDSPSNVVAAMSLVMVPPAAPTDLAAAVQVGPQVSLTWVDNATDENSFVLERSTGSGAFTQIATPGANVTSYVDTGVSAGTSYSYRIKAIGAGGESSYSNTATVNIPAAPPAPAAPTTLTATILTGPQVRLTWRDRATNETGFVVERSDDGGAFVAIATPGRRNFTGSVTYTDTTVVGGHSYQ